MLPLVGSLLAARVARADDAASEVRDSAGSSAPDDASTSTDATGSVGVGERRRPWLTARLALGVGGGNIGVCGKYSFSAEGWFSDNVGIGAFGGASAQSTVTLLGPSENENDEGLGLALALRSSPGRHYVLFSVGGAVAHGHEWRTAGLSLDGNSSVPAPIDHDGTSYDLVLGWLADTRGLEVGALMGLDVTSWGTATFTANVALGFGAR